MKIKNLRGTRDFYPEEMRKLNSIFNAWRNVAESFAYEEFDGPLLEPADMWRLKSGADIPDQMYVFTDKGDREVAIRPELTPTLARMIAQKQKELTKPIRWFSIPRCWRYEAPQSGRLREFFQFNLDILGTESMKADAEVIATAVGIMREFKCTNKEFYVRISNRKLVRSLLIGAGVEQSQLTEVSRLIDKIDKLSRKDFVLSMKDLNIKDRTVQAILDLIEIKDINRLDAKNIDGEGKKGFAELKELFKYLKVFKIDEYCEFDLSLMRGFDYYTSTVFEVFDRSKKFRAIAGGGRYDNLVEDFGGERCPGIGYGMGDVVLGMFLDKIKKFPESKRQLDYYVAPLTEEETPTAIKLSQRLRKDGFIVELDVMGRKVGKQAKYAASINAKSLIILGPEELKRNVANVKNLRTGEEENIKLA